MTGTWLIIIGATAMMWRDQPRPSGLTRSDVAPMLQEAYPANVVIPYDFRAKLRSLRHDQA